MIRERLQIIIEQSVVQIKEYYFYWIVQIVLPVTSLLFWGIINTEYKSLVLLIAVGVPMATVLPISIFINSHKKINKLNQLVNDYKLLIDTWRYEKDAIDEYHHITSYDVIYKIIGSDVSFDQTIRGINVHPEGKESREIKLLTGVDVENFQNEIEIRDNLRDLKLMPELIQLSKTMMLHVAKTQPTPVGQNIDYTISRFCAGAFTKGEEYIIENFNLYPRGVDKCNGTLLIDRELVSYYASRVNRDGKYEEVDLNLKGTQISHNEFVYNLEWSVNKPLGYLLIHLIMPEREFY